jgi:hypothetical protein
MVVEALTGARAAAERRCNDSRERQWRKLNARAEESERELESEGRRCGLLQGCALPFIGVRKAVVERQRAEMARG